MGMSRGSGKNKKASAYALRRSFIRGAWGLFSLAFFLPILLSCGQKPKILRLLIWPDYINSELISDFEKKEGCIVRVEYFFDNEDLKKKVREEEIEADIIVPSSYELKTFYDEGLIRKIELENLPNTRKYVTPLEIPWVSEEKKAKEDSLRYAVPYFIAPTGIAYRIPAEPLPRKNTGTNPKNWAFISEPTDGRLPAASFTILDDKREAIGAALIAAKGKGSANATDEDSLKAAKDKLLEWIRGGARINSSSYIYYLLGDKKEFAQSYMGETLAHKGKIGFALPAEGFVVTCDCLAITSESKNPELAARFIDFLSDPDNCAANMRWTLYRAPNDAAIRKLVDAEFEKLPIEPEGLELLTELLSDPNDFTANMWWSFYWVPNDTAVKKFRQAESGRLAEELKARMLLADLFSDPDNPATNVWWALYWVSTENAIKRIREDEFEKSYMEREVLYSLMIDWMNEERGGVILQPISPDEEKLYDELWEEVREADRAEKAADLKKAEGKKEAGEPESPRKGGQ